MLLEEIKNIKSEKNDLRNFGITFGVVLGLLAGALWWKGRDTYPIFIILSFLFFFFGLVLPNLLKPLQKAWMSFAVVLGFFMTNLILGILFYLVFTLIGVVSRLFGKQFLSLKKDRSIQSFWYYRKNKPFNKNDYENQF
ncbi:MAG: SxtJ family membrane protein [Nitrospirota bacterium]